MQPLAVWTVGHSNHPLETFAQLLLLHQVQLIADVRSHPYSKFAPHYGCEELPNTLSNLGVDYVFMGVALGGRPTNVEHYDEEGHALYEPMSKEPEFCEAIEEVCNRASQQRLALLCSEADPEYCHRRLLVGKVLADQGVLLHHIMADASVVTEKSVTLPPYTNQQTLFGAQEQRWRSTQSVLRRRQQNISLID